MVRPLNVGISPTKDNLKFYAVNKDAKAFLGDALPDWFDQLGSFKRENILKHLDGVLEPYIDETEVTIMTLDEVMDMNPNKKLNLLHIDAEGYDFQVLKSLSLEKYLPEVLIVEHKHLSSTDREELFTKLSQLNYSVSVYHDDFIAILTS